MTPLSSAALVAEGYERKEGASSVPDCPGFGLSLNEQAFAREVKVRFNLKK